MGNTRFEHFSSHRYLCLKSSILLWSLIGFIYDLFSKWFENRGLVAYTMTWVLRYGEVRFWFLGISDTNIYSLWRYLWFIKYWIWNGDLITYILCISVDMFLKLDLTSWDVVKHGFEICVFRRFWYSIWIGFEFWFIYDYK